MPRPPTRILCCSPIADPAWRWLAPAPGLRDLALAWHFFRRTATSPLERTIHTPDLALLLACRRCINHLATHGADLLVTHDPRITFWCALLTNWRGLRVRHLDASFTFATLPGPFKRHLMARAFRHVDRVVTFSRAQGDEYAREFQIPPEKIDVQLWGVNRPPTADPTPYLPNSLANGNKPYICAIGSNRRDYRTLLAAMKNLPDVPLVIVCYPQNLAGLRIPPNVHVASDVPYPATMGLLERSAFMALPLDAQNVNCGHGTLVAAMHLNKTFVVTQSPGLADYLTDPATNSPTGLTTPVNDPQSLSRTLRTLWYDTPQRHQLATTAHHFATTRCTEESTTAHFRAILQEWNLAAPANS